MGVTVVIPTYNEAENIAPLVDAVTAVLEDRNHSVLVVDDDSPDGTADRVRELQDRFDTLSLVERDERHGLGSAYKDAFGRVDDDIVVQMDADFSHRPDEILKLIDAIEDGYEVAVGSRYVTGGARNDPLHRRIFPLIGSYLYRYGVGTHVRDITSGFKAYDGAVVHRLAADDLPDGFHFQAASLMRLLWGGADVIEVPIDFQPRRAGDPKYTTADLLDNLFLFGRLCLSRWVGGVTGGTR